FQLVLSITSISFPETGNMENISELTAFMGNSASAMKRCMRLRQLDARLGESNPADTLTKFTDFTLHRAVIKRRMRRILDKWRSLPRRALNTVNGFVSLHS